MGYFQETRHHPKIVMVGLLALWFYLEITLFGSKESIDNEHAECEIRTIKEERIGTRRGSGAREEKHFCLFHESPQSHFV